MLFTSHDPTSIISSTASRGLQRTATTELKTKLGPLSLLQFASLWQIAFVFFFFQQVKDVTPLVFFVCFAYFLDKNYYLLLLLF